MEKLPTKVAIQIANRIAMAIADSMEDLGSMRATYSQMRRVYGDAVVGWIIPLWWVLLRGMQRGTWKWFYDHEYRTKLITRLDSVRNLEACFYAGMHIVFVEDRSALMP